MKARLLIAFCLTTLPHAAYGSLTVLVGEPFGSFGTMMPVGHTTIYLDELCADGPTRIRMCRAGEPTGVALARYDHLGSVDWVATPILEFLYATDRVETIPSFATVETVGQMRESYRRRFLADLFPDGSEWKRQNDEWQETVGIAYSRRLWGYEITTTRAQDQAFVEEMSRRPDVHRYRLRRANCADFAADVVNMYFPGVVRRNKVADLGLMSPKQVARSVSALGALRPELEAKVIEIAQVPGEARRSRPVWGGAEGLLKTKRYLATLLVIQPEVVVALTVLYVDRGRWRLGRDAELVEPSFFTRTADREVTVLSNAARFESVCSSAKGNRIGLDKLQR